MNMRLLAIRGLGIACLALSIAGQEQDDRPPVPFLSPAGTAPPGAENSYVFIDPSTEDAVVFYTQDGKPAGTNPFGPTTIRVDIKLSRHVEPSTRSEVVHNTETGAYEYRFQLMNGAGARQIAWSWLLDGVDAADTIAVRTPTGWTHRFPVRRVGHIEIPERFRRENPMLRSLQLFAADSGGGAEPSRGIRPGGMISGIEVVSRRLPGVIRVLVQGGFNVPTFPHEPPAGADEQVSTLIRSAYNYGRTFAIGPRFPPGTARATIAQATLRDLEELERRNVITPGSAFAGELKAFLAKDFQNIAGLEKAAGLARAPFERELVHGIRLALTGSR